MYQFVFCTEFIWRLQEGNDKASCFQCLSLRANYSYFHLVYLSVRTCEVFLCFVDIVRVRVYYFDSIFLCLRSLVSQVFTPRMSPTLSYQSRSYATRPKYSMGRNKDLVLCCNQWDITTLRCDVAPFLFLETYGNNESTLTNTQFSKLKARSYEEKK